MKNFTKTLLFLSLILISSIGALAQMSGTYTVSATGSANFNSMLAASTALAKTESVGLLLLILKMELIHALVLTLLQELHQLIR
jgi:hypothetical protein